MNSRPTGIVTTIRVRPDDQMSCIDIVQRACCLIDGMSITAIISRALAISCETLRESGTIPRRDGFEYDEMLAPYVVKTSHTKRARIKVGQELTLADNIAQRAERKRVPALQLNLTQGPSESNFTDAEQMARYLKWKDAKPALRGQIPISHVEDQYFRMLLKTTESQVSPNKLAAVKRSRNQNRIDELTWKRGNDPDNWTDAEELELNRLTGDGK